MPIGAGVSVSGAHIKDTLAAALPEAMDANVTAGFIDAQGGGLLLLLSWLLLLRGCWLLLWRLLLGWLLWRLLLIRVLLLQGLLSWGFEFAVAAAVAISRVRRPTLAWM